MKNFKAKQRKRKLNLVQEYRRKLSIGEDVKKIEKKIME
jgi:hypothetical protein